MSDNKFLALMLASIFGWFGGLFVMTWLFEEGGFVGYIALSVCCLFAIALITQDPLDDIL